MVLANTSDRNPLLPDLNNTVAVLTKEFAKISATRKEKLKPLTDIVQRQIRANQKVQLNFICTHNSRRSHLSQLWAQAAAHYYAIQGVACFSGGTAVTAFNPRAVSAMQSAGFDIRKREDGANPVYEVYYAPDAAPVLAFSKKYDDPFNSASDFTAILTCSHAEEHCPVVTGASARIVLTYDDPKEFDDTPLESIRYHERVQEIGRELLYAFAQVKA